MGLDPVGLARSVGLHASDLRASDRWIPAAAAARLLELSAELSGCADFGLRLAGLRRLGTLGPISVVARDEPDLRTALHLLIRYEHTYNEAVHMRLREEGERTTLSVWIELGEPAPTWQASDLVIGSLLGVIRALVGADWMPWSVSFTHDAPDDPAPYHRVCGPEVRFGRDATALVFPTSRLGAAVVTSDSSLRPYTRRFLPAVVPDSPGTAVARTREVVEHLLPLGRCSLQQVSRQLGLSTRELQRRLAEEGETFTSVVDATRARHAERHLQGAGRSLTEISLMLGFAAPSAFSRWFSQHFGTSPSAWRRAARATTADVPAPRRPAPTGDPDREPAASSPRGDAGRRRGGQVHRRAAGPSLGG
ncbi:AraC family transcriptional regulator [Blastococcus sp. SYSU D01042]